MKILISLLIVGAILVIAAYLRKRAIKDSVLHAQTPEEAKNVTV